MYSVAILGIRGIPGRCLACVEGVAVAVAAGAPGSGRHVLRLLVQCSMCPCSPVYSCKIYLISTLMRFMFFVCIRLDCALTADMCEIQRASVLYILFPILEAGKLFSFSTTGSAFAFCGSVYCFALTTYCTLSLGSQCNCMYSWRWGRAGASREPTCLSSRGASTLPSASASM